MNVSLLDRPRLGVDQRANHGQYVTDSARMTLGRIGPSVWAMAMASTICGTAKKMSEMRMIRLLRRSRADSRRRARAARRPQRRADGDDPDQDRDARAEQQPAVDVCAHPVRAEPVRPARWAQPLGRIDLEHGVGMRRQPWRTKRRRPPAPAISQAEQRQAVLERACAAPAEARSSRPGSRGSINRWTMSTSMLMTM